MVKELEKQLKPIKGFDSFGKIFKTGKKLSDNNALIVVSNSNKFTLKNEDKNSDILYFGVTISKKTAKKAVIRNRIKRLLRVSIKNYFENLNDTVEINFRYLIIVWKNAPLHPALIKLDDTFKTIENLLNKLTKNKVKN